MHVDVVVVNYRTNDLLYHFVESYRKFAPDNAQLVVVDVDPISPFGYRNVPGEYIVMKENKGYAAACNYVARRTNGEIIAFFNSDIILMEGTIQKCVTALEENPTWGVVGPLQYNSDQKINHAGIFGTMEQPKHWKWGRHVGPFARKVEKAVTVSGAAYFIKRSVWEELTECETYRTLYPDVEGAFLPTFLFFEETWCSYHAQAHGHEVYYFGEAECIHEWHGTLKRYGEARNISGESKIQFRAACDAHGIPHD